MIKTDNYPSIPLSQIKGSPIAYAKFKEPIFKLGIFQDDWVEVEVAVYPTKIINENKKVLVGVRFGKMNLIRYVPETELYGMRKA